MQPDPRCACCGDAYGTRWLCPACAADPANASWAEADEAETSSATPPDDRGVVELLPDGEAGWDPTPLQRSILRALLAGGSTRGVARLTGASEKHVKATLKRFKLESNP